MCRSDSDRAEPAAGFLLHLAGFDLQRLYAVHSDHINTPRRLTDNQGQVVWQWAYSAFGDAKPTTAHNRFADLDVTPNPGVTSFAEFMFNLRGKGQYFDVESGLRYNYFRSLMDIGRYTQPDPIGLGGGPNRIGHVGGNPLMFTDQFGLQSYAMCAAGLSAWCPPPAKDPEPPMINPSGYGTLQLLFPASTAYLVRNPVGGNPEGQICYANYVNDIYRKATSTAEMTVGGWGSASALALPIWLKVPEGRLIKESSKSIKAGH